MITATFGLALIHKGAAVSIKKASADLVRGRQLLNLSSKILTSIGSLSALADADSDAFQSYLRAGALPCTTERERSSRKAAREASLLRATQIPLQSAVEMDRGLEFVEAAEKLVDTHVRSDVLAGGFLLRASIKSVLLSVDANLSGISDVALRNALRQQRNELGPESKLVAEVNVH